MVVGIGTDIVEIIRIQNSYDKYGERFLKKVFTPTEIEYCEQFGAKKFLNYSARFAAKEAFSKAIGTGFSQGFKFLEVGVRNEKSGKPFFELTGSAFEKYKDFVFELSLSHSDNYSVAFVVMSRK